jgi:hypothetical protein
MRRRMAVCCQIGGCDRVGLDVIRALCRRRGSASGGQAASLHGCTPRRASRPPEASVMRGLWRRRVLLGDCPSLSLHLVRPRVTTTVCGLCPVKRCNAPFTLCPAFWRGRQQCISCELGHSGAVGFVAMRLYLYTLSHGCMPLFARVI